MACSPSRSAPPTGMRRAIPSIFFVVLDDTLHIIPVEALRDGALPLADLSRWRARTPDGLTLPAHFRPRFGREMMVVGQPMT